MNRVQEAYLLVQSLSKGERNRVSRSMGPTSNHYKLFTRLKKTGLSEVDLTWKTNYDKNDTARILLIKIAESMQNFGYAESKLRKERKRKLVVQWYIMDAQFFYERNIFRLCKKRLLEAEQEALGIYSYTHLLTIYNLLLELKIRTIGNQVSADINEEEIIKKLNECLLAVREYTQYRKITSQLYNISRQRLDAVNKEQTVSKFKEDLAESPATNLALQRYYQARGLYFLILNEPEKSLEYNKKAREWWELPKNSDYKNEELYQYLLTLNNNAQSCIAIIHHNLTEGSNLYFQYHKVIENILSKIENSTQTLRKDEEIKIRAAFYKNRINQLILSKQSHRIIPLVEEGLKKEKGIFDQFSVKDKIVLLCQYSAVCFSLKKYEKSYEHILLCYQFSKETVSIRRDLIQHLYLLEAIIYCIFKETDGGKVKQYFKGKSPINKRLESLTSYSEKSYLLRGLELLSTFDTCLPSERRKKFQPFAEHICQHTNRLFAMDIISWLKQYSLSSGLTQVVAIQI